MRTPPTDRESALVSMTRWLVFATLGLVIVGFIGLGAALLQWQALKSTDERIAQQVETMARAIDLMVIDQRAWLHLESLSVVSPLKNVSNKFEMAVDYGVKNSGKTAGFGVHIFGGMSAVWLDCAPLSPTGIPRILDMTKPACIIKNHSYEDVKTLLEHNIFTSDELVKNVCVSLRGNGNASKGIDISQNILPNQALPIWHFLGDLPKCPSGEFASRESRLAGGRA